MNIAARKAGLEDLRFHDLRHEATSRLFEETDLDVMEIRGITGHKSMQMLARYSHLRAHKLADRLAGKKGNANDDRFPFGTLNFPQSDRPSGLMLLLSTPDAMKRSVSPSKYLNSPMTINESRFRARSSSSWRIRFHGKSAVPSCRPLGEKTPRQKWSFGGSFTSWGSDTGRFGHPEQDRTISVREAALLQTLPSDYIITADHMKHACKIVGNALPCDFAEVLARSYFTALKQHQ
jgi:site-specific DNA-cytosine methylase